MCSYISISAVLLMDPLDSSYIQGNDIGDDKFAILAANL